MSRPTVTDLEKLLSSDDGSAPIEILPNGDIRVIPESERPAKAKPLTFRENLGGEYYGGAA